MYVLSRKIFQIEYFDFITNLLYIIVDVIYKTVQERENILRIHSI